VGTAIPSARFHSKRGGRRLQALLEGSHSPCHLLRPETRLGRALFAQFAEPRLYGGCGRAHESRFKPLGQFGYCWSFLRLVQLRGAPCVALLMTTRTGTTGRCLFLSFKQQQVHGERCSLQPHARCVRRHRDRSLGAESAHRPDWRLAKLYDGSHIGIAGSSAPCAGVQNPVPHTGLMDCTGGWLRTVGISVRSRSNDP